MNGVKPLWLLLPVFFLLPAQGAPRHNRPAPRPAHIAKPGRTGQKALLRTQTARKALQATLQRKASALEARKKAEQAARRLARRNAARAAALSAKKRAADAALARTRTKLSGLNEQLSSLQQQDADLTSRIHRQSASLHAILPTAAELSAAATPRLLAAPGPVEKNAQALSLLRASSHLSQARIADLHEQRSAVQQSADSLTSRQNTLAILRKNQTHRRNLTATRSRRAQEAERKAKIALDAAHRSVVQAMRETASLTDEIEKLSRQEAQTRARLEAEAKALARAHRNRQARHVHAQATALNNRGRGVALGKGFAPVSGKILVSWGQSTEAGPSTGVTYATTAHAPVLSPCTGRILFSGLFRSFGKMLILDCGHSQRFVLSGLGSLNVRNGQNVKRAAALGAMPAASGTLFMQLRHGTQVVDPLPFLRKSVR